MRHSHDSHAIHNRSQPQQDSPAVKARFIWSQNVDPGTKRLHRFDLQVWSGRWHDSCHTGAGVVHNEGVECPVFHGDSRKEVREKAMDWLKDHWPEAYEQRMKIRR